MDDSRTVIRRAHAKVNLALAVGPAIAPPSAFAGYHPIASWMASVDLFDDIEVARLDDGAASTHAIQWASDAPRPSPIDWPIEKDLAVRAHRLLEGEVGRELLLSMTVRKRIPVGGGLGGGSADAAGALMTIRDAFELPLSTARLAELSVKLGSDVAFFLDDHTPARGAVVSSLGEKIERVAAPDLPLVLFFPAFGCPTGAVYKSFDGSRAGEGFDVRAAAVQRLARDASRTGRLLTDDLFNDLAAPACRVQPNLREIIDRLAGALNVRVHVTGSGSTLFALAAAPEQASRLAARAGEVVPGVVGVATRVV